MSNSQNYVHNMHIYKKLYIQFNLIYLIFKITITGNYKYIQNMNTFYKQNLVLKMLVP